MFVQGEKFKHGDELIWTHKSGTTELVWFIEYSEATVTAPPNPSNQPEPLAVVTRAVRKEMTVPVSELSRPEQRVLAQPRAVSAP